VRRAFAQVGEPPLGDVPSVLIFGGSRGARSINDAMIDAAGRLAAADTPPRICVQTGPADEDRVRQAFADYPAGRAEVLEFIEDMPERLEAADLVLCRAGASTLSELTVAGRASILVPYPHAADDHQRHNAETMSEAGASVVILDDELDGARLTGAVLELASSRQRLSSMGRAARTLGRPRATETIADVAEDLIAGRRPARDGDVS
jgi:UDP-N-acetylglucosamine--N-acetylmuramyl-(pentapeptide) pyrophosphoryl-undecaprenol N-acetylglucosamine transferase